MPSISELYTSGNVPSTVPSEPEPSISSLYLGTDLYAPTVRPEQTEEELRKSVLEASGTPWYSYPGEMIAGVARGAGRTTGMALEGAQAISRDVAETIGLDPDVLELHRIGAAGRAIRGATERALPVDPTMEGGVISSVAEGVGSVVPAAAAFAAGGPAAIAGFGAATGYAGTYEQTLQLAKQAGLNDAEAKDSAKKYARVSALVTGVTEPFGAAARGIKIIKRLDDATGKWIGKQILKAGSGEALQEGLQEIPDEVARRAYIKERGLFDSLQAVGGAAALGGTVGVIFGGLAAAPGMIRTIRAHQRADALSPEAKVTILEDHAERVEAAQADPVPNKELRESVGLGDLTRKETAAVIDILKESERAETEAPKSEPTQAAEEVPQAQGEVGDVLAPPIGEAAKQAPTAPVTPQAKANMFAAENRPDVVLNDEYRRENGFWIRKGVPGFMGGSDIRVTDPTKIAELDAVAPRQESAPPDVPGQGGMPTVETAVTKLDAQIKNDFPASEQVQQQATIPPEAAGILPRGAIPTPPSQPAGYWPNPEVARRVANARTALKPAGLIEKMRAFATKTWQVTFRPQEHIPKNERRFAGANEYFRLLKDVPRHRQDEVNRTLAAIVGPLDKNGYRLFGDALLVRDQLRGMDAGLAPRMGFANRQELEQTQTKINADIQKSPSVQAALASREKVVRELTDQLVAEKLLPAEAAADPERYFHREVRMYMAATQQASARAGSRPRLRKYGFQRVRSKADLKAEEYDYMSDYLTAEFRWMVDAQTSLYKKRLFERFIVPSDISDQIGKDDPIPDGYREWQLKPGNSIYRPVSLPQRLAEEIMAQQMAMVSADDLKTVTAIGAPFKTYVVPNEIADQLDYVEAKAKETPHVVDALAVAVMNKWKQYTLLNPKRVVAYNLRNMLGDLDPSIGGLPSAMKLVPSATRELHDYYARKSPAMSPELRAARDLGVIDSALTVQEIPELGDLRPFERLYDRKFDPRVAPHNVVKLWFEKSRELTSFRESIMRYAAFLRYRELLKAGNLSYFGAGNEGVVRELQARFGDDVAAAHLARNLLGDYGNLPVLANWIRSRAIPFFSFQWTLFERYPRLAWNAAKMGDMKKAGSAALVGALRVATAARIGWMLAGLWAWNLWHKDEEDDLGEYDKSNPHAVLGRNPDGSVIVFRNFSALGELLEWFGLNTLASSWEKVADGQWTAADLAKEMAADPTNKIIQGIRPDVKAGAEQVFKRTLFPDARNPRLIEDRGEHIASIFGLADEYRWAKGKILEQGDRARAHYLQRLLTGVVDPKPNALLETHSLIDRFQSKKGKGRPDFVGNPYTRNMRRAVQAEDRAAFSEAKKAFLADGGTYKKFKAAVQRIDPVGPFLNAKDEREFFTEYLTPRQREVVKVARDYANDLGDTMTLWWKEAG